MQTDMRERKHADIKLKRLLAIDEQRLMMVCRDDAAGVEYTICQCGSTNVRYRAAKSASERV
jgi:hypothetical protein